MSPIITVCCVAEWEERAFALHAASGRNQTVAQAPACDPTGFGAGAVHLINEQAGTPRVRYSSWQAKEPPAQRAGSSQAGPPAGGHLND